MSLLHRKDQEVEGFVLFNCISEQEIPESIVGKSVISHNYPK